MCKSNTLLKVGLTGGIGSGKTYVARHFEKLGIPVYYADAKAKYLMSYDAGLKAGIKALLGSESYHRNGRLNRDHIRSAIFSDGKLLSKINSLVHPAVYNDFLLWSAQQDAAYVIEESAIIYENELQDRFDVVILVTADVETRIIRVMKRDKADRQRVVSIMKKQLNDHDKIGLANFVVTNTDSSDIVAQVKNIHEQLLKIK